MHLFAIKIMYSFVYMPYDNAYNRAISAQLRNIDQQHINRIQAISETNQFDVRTPLESLALHNENIQGGSGFSAATIQDLGYEPTDGATPATGGRIRKTRARKNLAGSGSSGGGTSGGGTSGGGMSAGGASGGALLTLQDLDKMHGQPPPGRQKKVTLQASPWKDQPLPQASRAIPVGGGMSAGNMPERQPSARNLLVRQVMAEQKLSLPQASKYIKENGLYKR